MDDADRVPLLGQPPGVPVQLPMPSLGSSPPSTLPGSPPSAAAAADTPPVWTPPAELPAPSTGSQRIDIVLSPHPDDETLSLGVWVANAVAQGDRVIVVCLTDGRSTGAITQVSQRLRRPVSRDEIAAARIRELRAATAQLGIGAGDVYLAGLDAEQGPGGTRVTEPEALAVIETFAGRFPAATFATMSWAAEQHPDHLGAGYALQEAAARGLVQHAVFAVSRLWWALPSPAASVVLPLNATVRRRVELAGRAYDVWDPADQRLAIGWTSVHQQFVALLADPRDRIHGWAPRTTTATAGPGAGE
jgi:LmbE family N-acetylglucosaminyl deacetylase